jgi:flagellar biosynthesis/type III secretory pathway protein FliH
LSIDDEFSPFSFQGLPGSPGSGVVLFDDDFDLPPAAAPLPSVEPEIIEPVFTAAELVSARENAAVEARDAALAEAEASGTAAARRALATISSQIAATRAEVSVVAEQSAEAIARLLLDCFATAFPALSARHGPSELSAVLRRVLPALHREPRLTVRVNPHTIGAMTAEIGSLDPDLAAHVRLIPTDAMAPEDVRIDWDNGVAQRDTKALWRQIEGILAPAGLLTAAETTGAAGLATMERTDTTTIAKEHELAD